MKILQIVFWIFIFLFAPDASAQKSFPAGYFRPPLNIPLYLSGTFGELRSNHFHAGIDIKTEGVEGLKVYAAADGYVSRVKVALGGYGNAIYITHPNGYTTVYGHLKTFNKKIAAYVHKNQYKRKSFVVDLFPEKGLLKVTKGEVIALSGNTGGSLGPHLHFEIREAANQHPLNPLLFKSIKISDNKKPVVAQLVIYPVADTSLVNNKHDTAFYTVIPSKNGYVLKNDSVVDVFGKIAFGLRAYDRMNKIRNKNGIYCERLFIDSVAVFNIKMDELSFYTSRYINSLIDYRYFKQTKRRLVRTQLDTNNRLTVYKTIKSNGVFSFNDTLPHSAEYVVSDAYGNKSRFAFSIKNVRPDTVISFKKSNKNDHSVFVVFSKKASIKTDSLRVHFPANTFYCSQKINYGWQSGGDTDYFSPVYFVGDKYIPVQKYFNISMAVSRPVPDSLRSKLYIAKYNDDGKWDFAGGQFDKGWLTAKMRSAGKFVVLTDTVSPEIKAVNIAGNKKVANRKELQIKITDKQTGIKKYAGFLNERWILMEYNPKKAMLTYRFDRLLKKGKNRFKLVVFDNRDNKSVYETDLFY